MVGNKHSLIKIDRRCRELLSIVIKSYSTQVKCYHVGNHINFASITYVYDIKTGRFWLSRLRAHRKTVV